VGGKRWPQTPGQKNLYDDNGPLHHYDWYVWKTRGYNPETQGWQRQNKSNGASWAGHCQAWAAASILTTEPPAGGVTHGGVHFSHDTLEGLLTTVYETPTVEGFWGTRYNGASSGQAALDVLDPAWMDYLLRYYVQQHGTSFVMDTDKGAPVWNFPVAGFNRREQDIGNGVRRVTTDVWFRSPTPDVAGYDAKTFFSKTYVYDLWNTSTGASNGRWVSDDHPDFAWRPGRPQASDGAGTLRNPRLDPAIVEEILGRRLGLSANRPVLWIPPSGLV